MTELPRAMVGHNGNDDDGDSAKTRKVSSISSGYDKSAKHRKMSRLKQGYLPHNSQSKTFFVHHSFGSIMAKKL
jgi:hypothetical protein